MNIILDLSTILHLTDEQYYKLATAHKHLRMERDRQGRLIIMPPTGGNTGRRNLGLSGQLWNWIQQNSDLGVGFDSSTEFKLPNGANRSPDASWIKMERWNSLTQAEQEKFPPLCPDFVIELRSPSDSLTELQQKMQEYLDNGARLGWLIDPKTKIVEIYRQGQEKEVLRSPSALLGEDVLPGFVLQLRSIWST